MATHTQSYDTSNLYAWVRFMVFNATFNNISVISWRSVLLVEETDLSQVPNKLYYIMLYRYTSPEWDSNPQITTVVIGTDCIGSVQLFDSKINDADPYLTGYTS